MDGAQVIIKEEFVAKGRAIWQSDAAKTYQCPTCYLPIFSQHEGDDQPTIACNPDGHRLQWSVAEAEVRK